MSIPGAPCIGMVGLNHQYLQNAFLLLLLFSIALASGNLIVGNIEIKEKEKTNSLSEGLYCRWNSRIIMCVVI